MSSKFQICSSLAILLLALVIVVMGVAEEATDTKFVSAKCNTKKIPRGSQFYNNLRDVLQDLKQNTAYNSYDYKTSSGGGGGAPTAYGHATCKQSISESDCTSCVSNASDRIYNICSNAVGARVQLVDCYLQYEQHMF